MSKRKIKQTVELYLDEVSLVVWVNKDLNYRDERPENFGHITVGLYGDDSKNCIWDGIEFFMACDKDEFKKECKQELKQKGYNVNETWKAIQRLLKRADKLQILKANDNIIHHILSDNPSPLDSGFRTTNGQTSEEQEYGQ